MLRFHKLFGRARLECAALLFENSVRFVPLMKRENLLSKKNATYILALWKSMLCSSFSPPPLLVWSHYFKYAILIFFIYICELWCPQKKKPKLWNDHWWSGQVQEPCAYCKCIATCTRTFLTLFLPGETYGQRPSKSPITEISIVFFEKMKFPL